MYQKPKVPDHQIVQKVTTQLPRHGIRPPCNVRVHVRNGTVTLSGTIEFEMQRKAAIHAASGVNGVQRVIDQLTVMRSTIGGWHTPTAGTQLKHVRNRPHYGASSHATAESVSPSRETTETKSPEEPLLGSSEKPTSVAYPAGEPLLGSSAEAMPATDSSEEPLMGSSADAASPPDVPKKPK